MDIERARQLIADIIPGSKTTGRWLDAKGHECSEDTPGAVWEEYTEEEQEQWLATVVDLAEQALAALDGAVQANPVTAPFAVPKPPAEPDKLVIVLNTGGELESVHFHDMAKLDVVLVDHNQLVADGLDFEEREDLDEEVTAGLQASVDWRTARPRWFRNHYCHQDCPRQTPGPMWEDEWFSASDDECPACGADISPHQSDEIPYPSNLGENHAQ